MKRKLALTLAVLACALAVCTAGLFALNDAVDEAERLQSLAVLWEGRGALMETLASHDALHEVSAALAEAQICLECEDHDDFLRTMSTVRMGLSHLRDEQALRLSNLY